MLDAFDNRLKLSVGLDDNKRYDDQIKRGGFENESKQQISVNINGFLMEGNEARWLPRLARKFALEVVGWVLGGEFGGRRKIEGGSFHLVQVRAQ